MRLSYPEGAEGIGLAILRHRSVGRVHVGRYPPEAVPLRPCGSIGSGLRLPCGLQHLPGRRGRSVGRDCGSGQQSGRAIIAQQQAGLAELAPIYDSLADWTERVYRAVWNRIRQFWTEPRWIRITDDNEAPRFLGINQIVMGPMGPQMVNNVGEIDVDILIDQAPDYASLRAEQFEALTNMASRGVPIPPQLIIEASEIPDKKRLLEMLKPDPQQAAMQQQMQMRAMDAEIGEKEANAERVRAAAAKDLAAIPKIRAEATRAAVEAAGRPDEIAARVASMRRPEPPRAA